ncbi:MAG: hypothetical protein HY360_22600 [Verrucomicrobia bacterium]|nr:hypothetical protein [Verrucomicrobiota bacterium]
MTRRRIKRRVVVAEVNARADVAGNPAVREDQSRQQGGAVPFTFLDNTVYFGRGCNAGDGRDVETLDILYIAGMSEGHAPQPRDDAVNDPGRKKRHSREGGNPIGKAEKGRPGFPPSRE